VYRRYRKQLGSQAILKPLVPVNLGYELLTRPPAHAWCYTHESIARNGRYLKFLKSMPQEISQERMV
jgi:hypothetical protein